MARKQWAISLPEQMYLGLEWISLFAWCLMNAYAREALVNTREKWITYLKVVLKQSYRIIRKQYVEMVAKPVKYCVFQESVLKMKFLWISQQINKEKIARKQFFEVKVKALSPTASKNRYIFHFLVHDNSPIANIGIAINAPDWVQGASVYRKLNLAVAATTIAKRKSTQGSFQRGVSKGQWKYAKSRKQRKGESGVSFKRKPRSLYRIVLKMREPLT